MTIHCYAATAVKEPLTPFHYTAKPIGLWEVEIAITHCGICHSDVHLIDNDWHISQYPLVPGHEVIGLVTARGQEVKHLREGQRVGIGWQCGACLTCENCLAGEEQLCGRKSETCLGRFGGFAEKIIVDSRFAFPIPAGIESAQAAPLMCGGITVYTPIREYVKPAMRVGVIGIGGLGHLALQFLNAFGCEVTAFSSTADKEQEAKKLGAHYFIASSDTNAMQKAINSLDFILSTVHVDLNWKDYVKILRPKGKLCFVGASLKNINISPMDLISGSKTICGSNIGSRHVIQEMLEVADRHHIKAQIEVISMEKVNDALQRVKNNQARYRIVLVNQKTNF